jgi:hypothetical protein
MRGTCLVLLLAGAALAQDSDGDGLPDFEERHKYFTDPSSADSDGDGVPDGDWGERREYAYTVRTIVQVMRPAEAISDDYQDARVLDATDAYVELEVVHYPLNTVAEAIVPDPEWRGGAGAPREYLEPTTTANWDGEMRAELLAALAADGIDVAALDDRAVVEQASAWLLRRAKGVDDFTTFFTHFPGGRPAILPGLEGAAAQYAQGDLSMEQRWERELFAKGMFRNRTHGSCTSTAIYLQGCLRAAGIPTRTILCIPAVDASDDREMEMVKRGLTHHRVRQTVLGALEGIRGSWSSHTFNEVWVGGRWRRLNYSRLGQNILDPSCFGLMTHVATMRDWADAEGAGTVGRRQHLRRFDDAFGHRNPYSALTISDRFGPHANVANEPLPEFKELTVTRAVWYDSSERPDDVSMKLGDAASGHVLLQVKENRAGGGTAQYATFWEQVGKAFALRAEERPEVQARAERGYWGNGWFYIRIPPEELAKMAVDVPYALVALNGDAKYRWTVGPDVTLARATPFTELTIEAAVFSDDPSLPEPLRAELAKQGLHLLLRPREWDGWEKFKRFTAEADDTFYLEAEGRPPIEFHTGTGGITGNGGEMRFAVGQLSPEPASGVRYRVRPRNERPDRRWVVAEGLEVVRE